MCDRKTKRQTKIVWQQIHHLKIGIFVVKSDAFVIRVDKEMATDYLSTKCPFCYVEVQIGDEFDTHKDSFHPNPEWPKKLNKPMVVLTKTKSYNFYHARYQRGDILFFCVFLNGTKIEAEKFVANLEFKSAKKTLNFRVDILPLELVPKNLTAMFGNENYENFFFSLWIKDFEKCQLKTNIVKKTTNKCI